MRWPTGHRRSSWPTTTPAEVWSRHRAMSRSPPSSRRRDPLWASNCWTTSSSTGRHTSVSWRKGSCRIAVRILAAPAYRRQVNIFAAAGLDKPDIKGDVPAFVPFRGGVSGRPSGGIAKTSSTSVRRALVRSIRAPGRLSDSMLPRFIVAAPCGGVGPAPTLKIEHAAFGLQRARMPLELLCRLGQ